MKILKYSDKWPLLPIFSLFCFGMSALYHEKSQGLVTVSELIVASLLAVTNNLLSQFFAYRRGFEEGQKAKEEAAAK